MIVLRLKMIILRNAHIVGNLFVMKLLSVDTVNLIYQNFHLNITLKHNTDEINGEYELTSMELKPFEDSTNQSK